MKACGKRAQRNHLAHMIAIARRAMQVAREDRIGTLHRAKVQRMLFEFAIEHLANVGASCSAAQLRMLGAALELDK
jgi:hypothetical protein